MGQLNHAAIKPAHNREVYAEKTPMHQHYRASCNHWPPTFRQQLGRDMDIKSKRETIAEIQEGVSLALTFPPQELGLMVSFCPLKFMQ